MKILKSPMAVKREPIAELLVESGVLVDREGDFTVLRGPRDFLEKAIDAFDLNPVAPVLGEEDAVSEVHAPGGLGKATPAQVKQWRNDE